MEDDLAREDRARVEAQLAAKGAITSACPMCKGRVWYFNGGERAVVTGIKAHGTFRMDCVILACSNCGFIRMHNVELLYED
jgi:uncharacterized protein YbaR (Trm112 family)